MSALPLMDELGILLPVLHQSTALNAINFPLILPIIVLIIFNHFITFSHTRQPKFYQIRVPGTIH